MKLKFKTQAYQTAAVQAVVDCFKGQPPATDSSSTYRIDPGTDPRAMEDLFRNGFKNADLALDDAQLLQNIQDVQRHQNLPIARSLHDFKIINGTVTNAYLNAAKAMAKLHLDVEMETGTGKTYCYIKTIFELNKLYGWSKFIIVVPSIAIREGVAQSFQITADHFLETYHKKTRFFIYNSKDLSRLESFSSDSGINVMIINVQAFAARGADNRRIYDVLDDFQSRKPIDVISANRPILILDEPQKMEGPATLEALGAFKALFVLRYSATHRTIHNKIHRLDALDAYNQKLVKKITVRGISVKGLAGTAGYLYLQSIEISRERPPVARVEFEQKLEGGRIKRVMRKLGKGDNLFDLSNGLDQYRTGYVVSDINAVSDTLTFTNGVELTCGDATGDVTESTVRRIQIRETIKAHLEKERALYPLGIKVLSLFFIDQVVKYRDYDADDDQGEYARMFEEEYRQLMQEEIDLFETPYTAYLRSIPAEQTHRGYFSIDKKTKHLTDPSVNARGENIGLSDDVDAYDLILKQKERLLSLSEPVRFLFSHSALREGWDNPNVFVICTLKQSDNTISRRQEVGRGLRLAVNQNGDRMDHPTTVHDVNVLTVVASESYQDFVAGLQRDISESLSERPRFANVEYFLGKQMVTSTEKLEVSRPIANQIFRYLVRHGYNDDHDRITDVYFEAKKAGKLADLPPDLQPYSEQVFRLIDSVFSDELLPEIVDDRKPKQNPLNANFEKREFRELWDRINRKAVYTVQFNSDELVQKSIRALNDTLRVTPLQYIVQRGTQQDEISAEDLRSGVGFAASESEVEFSKQTVHSAVRYDLVGKLSEGTILTRRIVVDILKGLENAVFDQFKTNPESFIAEAIRLINEQKATVIIEHLTYNPLDDRFELDIFTADRTKQNFQLAGEKLNKHIYDYVITDSKVEREFVQNLDISTDVVVYTKLPKGFLIPTPVGDYNPDWAISFKEGDIKHVYFVAETKGTMSSMELREIEKIKIDCARKFFEEIGRKVADHPVKYDVVDSFGKLMEVVR